eukprot:TRINITY_DN1353_c0_g1_i1.p1 TRINITY_DN1353_c0_g1~~TRINITY_DN1353_c0_g1_i1.p1  ORF type:complete len:526 (+),score=124.88 TRINITY_DN1353_c0_g1_i1:191-1768(+)
MKTPILFFCLLLCSLVVAKVVPPTTLNAYYEGRSGDILITPNAENLKNDASLYLYNAAPYNSKEIADSSIAELISHLMGTTPLSANTNRAAFPKTDFFKKPKANLLVVVDSNDASFEKTRVGSRIEVTPSSLTSDKISSLATIATGSTPSAHGIVGRTWMNLAGVVETAYVANAQPAIVSYADIISQTFEGVSLTVSISGDFQMASALAAHKSTLHSKPSWNNFAYFWDSRTQSVESLSVAGRLGQFSRNTVVDGLRHLEENGFTFTQQGEEVVIRSSSGSAVFTLSEIEDLRFLVELGMISSLPQHLQSAVVSHLVADEIPDFFAVSISTLQAIKNKYPVEKYNAAVQLADAVISKIVSQLESAYKSSFVAEVVFLGSSVAPLSAEVISTTNLLLEHDLVSEKVDEELLPNIYLKSYITTSQRNADCAALTRSLADFDVVIYCPERTYTPMMHHSVRALFESNSTNNNTNNTVQLTTDQLTSFQIIFWLIPILGLAVFFSIYAVCTISTGKDTILVVSSSAHKK